MELNDYLEILNDTGFFLQMRVAKEARDCNYKVMEEVSFEHGGQAARLDVLAEVSVPFGSGYRRSFVLIESKRHSAHYSSWIFFKPQAVRKPPAPYVLRLGAFPPNNHADADLFYSHSVETSYGELTLALMPYPLAPKFQQLQVGNIAIEAKLTEAKHRMEDLTRVSKKVTIAAHGMVMELEERTRRGQESREDTVYFIPVIVTTANLLVADTEVSKVALENGKLSVEGLQLQDVPWVVYEYSLPAELLLPVNKGSERWSSEREDYLRRRHILVVNSVRLREFLIYLRESLTLRF